MVVQGKVGGFARISRLFDLHSEHLASPGELSKPDNTLSLPNTGYAGSPGMALWPTNSPDSGGIASERPAP